ncbi:TraB/GumN family protein [Kosakonia sp.]|uniref:TraB/GumN family protein n=1 Tax=Kosakonia sp. TaxID=1916651 RepID=UPI00289BAC19|nr:TraB/GumN family protein [Kosakonia sp.]
MALFHRLKNVVRALFTRRYSWPAQDIVLPGNRILHLVGSIHMGTHGMSPLPGALLQKLREADALIVEADVAGSDSPFDNLPPAAPLEQRLSAEWLGKLDTILQTLSLPRDEFDDRPAWHIALVLQATQAQRLGLRPEYGIDYQLLRAAQQYQVAIMELEGTTSQLDILRELPDEGNELLQDTLTHWHDNARLLQVMISWWLENPPADDQMALPSTFSQPLHDVLMYQRNQAWCERLFALPPGRYVVAAGALHLYGDGNLPSLLREKMAQ